MFSWKKPLTSRILSREIQLPRDKNVIEFLQEVQIHVNRKDFKWLIDKIQARPIFENPVVAFKTIWIIHEVSHLHSPSGCLATAGTEPIVTRITQKWSTFQAVIKDSNRARGFDGSLHSNDDLSAEFLQDTKSLQDAIVEYGNFVNIRLDCHAFFGHIVNVRWELFPEASSALATRAQSNGTPDCSRQKDSNRQYAAQPEVCASSNEPTEFEHGPKSPPTSIVLSSYPIAIERTVGLLGALGSALQRLVEQQQSLYFPLFLPVVERCTDEAGLLLALFLELIIRMLRQISSNGQAPVAHSTITSRARVFGSNLSYAPVRHSELFSHYLSQLRAENLAFAGNLLQHVREPIFKFLEFFNNFLVALSKISQQCCYHDRWDPVIASARAAFTAACREVQQLFLQKPSFAGTCGYNAMLSSLETQIGMSAVESLDRMGRIGDVAEDGRGYSETYRLVHGEKKTQGSSHAVDTDNYSPAIPSSSIIRRRLFRRSRSTSSTSSHYSAASARRARGRRSHTSSPRIHNPSRLRPQGPPRTNTPDTAAINNSTGGGRPLAWRPGQPYPAMDRGEVDCNRNGPSFVKQQLLSTAPVAPQPPQPPGTFDPGSQGRRPQFGGWISLLDQQRSSDSVMADGASHGLSPRKSRDLPPVAAATPVEGGKNVVTQFNNLQDTPPNSESGDPVWHLPGAGYQHGVPTSLSCSHSSPGSWQDTPVQPHSGPLCTQLGVVGVNSNLHPHYGGGKFATAVAQGCSTPLAGVQAGTDQSASDDTGLYSTTAPRFGGITSSGNNSSLAAAAAPEKLQSGTTIPTSAECLRQHVRQKRQFARGREAPDSPRGQRSVSIVPWPLADVTARQTIAASRNVNQSSNEIAMVLPGSIHPAVVPVKSPGPLDSAVCYQAQVAPSLSPRRISGTEIRHKGAPGVGDGVRGCGPRLLDANCGHPSKATGIAEGVNNPKLRGRVKHCSTVDAAGRPLPESSPRQSASVGIRRTISPPRRLGALQIPAELEIDLREVYIGELIGRGATAEVYRGRWRGVEVAIKRLVRKASSSLSAKGSPGVAKPLAKEFFREMGVLLRLRHPNLVLLLGAVTLSSPLCLMTEYCAGGNLFELLHGKRHSGGVREKPLKLAPNQKIKICSDIACAMLCLHASTPPVIHRDLKSLNILLASPVRSTSEVPVAKVSDFGLSRIKAPDVCHWGPLTGMAGTFHWMAPEVLANAGYTEKADVYSFGIVMYEILSQSIPYSEIGASKTAGITVAINVSHGVRPNLAKISPDIPASIVELMQRCWLVEPASRPQFQEIVATIDGAARSLDR